MTDTTFLPETAQPLPYYVALADVFPLGQLDPRRFETLAEQLLKAEQIVTSGYDAVALMPEGADRGRDIVLYRSGRPAGVVQCKRYDRPIGLTAIVDEAIKLVLAGILDPDLLPDEDAGYAYEFWTALDLRADGRRLFDETATMMPIVATLVPDAVKRLRKKFKSLRIPPERATSGQDPDAEAVRIALERLPQWTWTHTGGEAIAAALNRQREVRRRFFRGHNDLDRPLAAEVDALLDAMRSRQIHDWEERNQAVTIEKVPRRDLDQHYDVFLASGRRVLAVVGGSGLGKSSWAIQLLERSRPGLRVHLLRGEDIDPGDDNALQSLLRVLTQRNPGEHEAGALAAAFWAWLDSDNRILVIDGLDRVGSAVRERLLNWLENTFGLARNGPVRFVLTSRYEQWRALLPGLQGREPLFFDPDSEGAFSFGQTSGGAVLLDSLDDKETALFHTAFGLEPARRAFRTPSLIANAARGTDRGSTTRLGVFRSRVAAVETELHARGYGRWAVRDAFRHIGRMLLVVADGRLDPAKIQAASPPGLLDALVAADILVPAGDCLRLEQDELTELLMGEVMNIDEAFSEVEARRDEALFLGGLAMALAILESVDPDLGRTKLADLARQAKTSWARWEVVARAAAEFEDHEALLPLLRKLIHDWPFSNVTLAASAMGDLLYEIGLSPTDHFDLLFPMAAGEDSDDWRSKYWLGAAERPWRTGFANAALHLAFYNGDVLVDRLLDAVGERDGTACNVALGLLYEAMTLHGALVIEAAFARRLENLAFDNLAIVDPDLTFSLLERHVEAGTCDIEDAVQIFDQLPEKARVFKADVDARHRDRVAELARLWLSRPMSSWSRAKLIVTLLATSSHAHADLETELPGLIPQMDRFDVWRAVRYARESQDRLLQAAFTRALDPEDGGRVLEIFDPASVPPSKFETLMQLFRHTAASGTDAAGRPLADAIELLLYSTEGRASHSAVVSLAEALLPVLSKARKSFIYYAGSPQDDPNPDATAARHRLFSALVDVEDGATLEVLVWKIFQSANQRPDPVDHLRILVQKLGYPLVKAAADRHASLELNGKWLAPFLAALE